MFMQPRIRRHPEGRVASSESAEREGQDPPTKEACAPAKGGKDRDGHGGGHAGAHRKARLALSQPRRGRITRRILVAAEGMPRTDPSRASASRGLLAARAFAAFRVLAAPFLRGLLRVPDLALHEHQGTGDRGSCRPNERVGELAAGCGHFLDAACELLQKSHVPPRCLGRYEAVGDYLASFSMTTGNESAKRLQSASETVNDTRRNSPPCFFDRYDPARVWTRGSNNRCYSTIAGFAPSEARSTTNMFALEGNTVSETPSTFKTVWRIVS